MEFEEELQKSKIHLISSSYSPIKNKILSKQEKSDDYVNHDVKPKKIENKIYLLTRREKPKLQKIKNSNKEEEMIVNQQKNMEDKEIQTIEFLNISYEEEKEIDYDSVVDENKLNQLNEQNENELKLLVMKKLNQNEKIMNTVVDNQEAEHEITYSPYKSEYHLLKKNISDSVAFSEQIQITKTLYEDKQWTKKLKLNSSQIKIFLVSKGKY